jgi:5-methylcytosine-specific restriction endonuclease McrA
MHDYALAHLSDAALLRELASLVARDRITTASLLAHIAEVDARKLYVPAGFSSMFAYCVEELRLSEDAAAKRIQAARAARRFPTLFASLAEGQLHLAAVCLLAPHLTPDNADELIQAATNRKKSEIEIWIARRFTAPERPAIVRAVPPPPPRMESQHAPGHVGTGTLSLGAAPEPTPTRIQHAPGHVESPRSEPAQERYLIQVTVSKSTHDKLRYAQELLSHAVPRGDVAQVIDRALDALIAQLERRKFGAKRVEAPRNEPSAARSRPRRSAAKTRYIPAAIRRAVWKRDSGQCTFVGSSGKRCAARKLLEFDHVEPVARGGTASVEGIRLRCRAHNQYEAERALGTSIMSRKRAEASKSRSVRLAVARVRERAAEANGQTAEGNGWTAEANGRAAEANGEALPRRALPGSGTLHGWESSIGSGKG